MVDTKFVGLEVTTGFSCNENDKKINGHAISFFTGIKHNPIEGENCDGENWKDIVFVI